MGVFRRYHHLYYTKRLKYLPGEASVPAVSVVVISRVHPHYNLILRDKTFRTVNWIYYNPVRRIIVSVFVPGILPAVSKVHPSRNPRLRDRTFRPPFLDYYQPKRLIYSSEFTPGALNAVSKVHPSRNSRLRDTTFRPLNLAAYQPKRALPTVTTAVVDVSFVAVSRVHPSRNLLLRQRHLERQYYQPKRVIYPSLFVAGILILVSKVHPGRNRRLRDGTFRPPFLSYYQPRHTGAFNLEIVATGLTEVLFKGMWRGMFRSMR